jgi:molybdate transport repressor ModE-like protein
MTSRIDWDSQIGRRLRLRDLYVFSTVARLGSMGKAARELGVSQPAISEVIADLEHVLGARLLDRTSRGIKVTAYGTAFERRIIAAFDELKQGVRDIEHLLDPTAGEVRVGCAESVAAAILPPICEAFLRKYPRVALDVDNVNTLSFAQKLQDRSLDVVLVRGGLPLEDPQLVSEFKVETLFHDSLVIAVAKDSPWAARRKLALADLKDERWILSDSGLFNHQIIADAFRLAGLEMPLVSMRTISVNLRASLVRTGEFVTTFPKSVLDLHADRLGLKALQLELPAAPWPVKIATLRDRTPGAATERFIACAYDVMGSASRKQHIGARSRRRLISNAHVVE